MAGKQLYQVFTDNPLTPALTDVAPFQPNDAGATEMGANTWQSIKDMLQPYKIYRALLTQTSTNNPVVTELQNDLGGAVTITRSSAGQYSIASSSLFTTGKTFATPQWGTLRQGSNYGTTVVALSNTSQIIVTTYLNGVVGDDLLSNFPLEILVYL